MLVSFRKQELASVQYPSEIQGLSYLLAQDFTYNTVRRNCRNDYVEPNFHNRHSWEVVKLQGVWNNLHSNAARLPGSLSSEVPPLGLFIGFSGIGGSVTATRLYIGL